MLQDIFIKSVNNKYKDILTSLYLYVQLNWLHLNLPHFLLMSLITTSLAPSSSVPSVCVCLHKQSQTTRYLKHYNIPRPACQPQLLLQIMLSTKIDIFNHHGISLKNTIKSNTILFQFFVYLLLFPQFILSIIAFSFSLLISVC